MVAFLLFGLAALWLWGAFSIPVLGQLKDTVLLTVRGHELTVWQALVLLVILTLISLLPTPIREIVAVLLLIWISAVMGYLFSGGTSSLILVLIIVGVAAYLSELP